MKDLIRYLTLTSLLAAGFPLQAEVKTAGVASVPVIAPEDMAWESVRSAAYASQDQAIANAIDDATLKAAVAQQAARFRASADLARDFYQKNPTHPKAVDARKLESLMLIQAVQSGDTSIEGRMESAVLAFNTDKSVPEAYRAEIAGVHSFSGLTQKNLQGDELKSAQENVARSLVLSFPNQPQGYESLLTIAAEREATKGRVLAEEILTMPAPPAVKQGAQLLVDRLDLMGKPLAKILSDAGASQAAAAMKKGKPTVIYTWATWSPGSVALGDMLAKRNTAGANIIGVNLDEDTSASGKLAQVHHLTGSLHYDGRGMKGALAKGLKVNGAPLVYFVDAQGVIRDVRGMDGLEQKLTENGL